MDCKNCSFFCLTDQYSPSSSSLLFSTVFRSLFIVINFWFLSFYTIKQKASYHIIFKRFSGFCFRIVKQNFVPMLIVFASSYTQTSRFSQFSVLSLTCVVTSLHDEPHLLLFTVFTVLFITSFCWLHLYLVIRYFTMYHSPLKCVVFFPVFCEEHLMTH